MSQQLTPAQIEALADQCSTSPKAYREFVRNLTSKPETYNLSDSVMSGLVEALGRLTPASLELDHFKRAMTYGEKLRINPPLCTHSLDVLVLTARADRKNGLELTEAQTKRLLLIHALLGKLTEAMELAPILLDLITGKEAFDEVNLLEELGDDAFYTALAEHACDYAKGSVVYQNVKKLGQRYSGGVFTRKEAVNRDLGAERTALEDTK